MCLLLGEWLPLIRRCGEVGSLMLGGDAFSMEYYDEALPASVTVEHCMKSVQAVISPTTLLYFARTCSSP